jgi:hypothetical protein
MLGLITLKIYQTIKLKFKNMDIKFHMGFLSATNNYAFKTLRLQFGPWIKLKIIATAHINKVVPCRSGSSKPLETFIP